MSQTTDQLLQKWREELKALELQVRDLSGNPPKVRHTTQRGQVNAATVAALERQVAELKRLIKDREARLA